MKIINRITVSFGAFFGLAIFGAFMTFNTVNASVTPLQESGAVGAPAERTVSSGGIDSAIWSCDNIDSCS